MTAGAEKSARRLRPEKPWFLAEGRGFDSRHLHLHLPMDRPWGRREIRGHLFANLRARWARPRDAGPHLLLAARRLSAARAV